MEIIIDPNKNAYENANTYFESSKKLRQKQEDAKKALEQTKKEIQNEEKKQNERDQEKKMKEQNQERKKEWHYAYHSFLTSDGFLAIGGKSAGQNEEIVKRRLTDNDLFFHADIKGASVVILINGKNASEKSKEETAQFAACYSTAWKAGYSVVDVYYVFKEQVSKSPPPGQYLEKGSFFISGKKNYFRNVPLKLLIGLDESGELKCVPEKSGMEKFKTCFIVEPGRYKKDIVAEKIARQLNKSKDEIMSLIPTGDSSFQRMK